jgi:hypothetical protein
VGWLLLESLVAFAILVAIVAWTMGPAAGRRRSRRDGRETPDASAREDDGDRRSAPRKSD